jgi:hypothetical protein
MLHIYQERIFRMTLFASWTDNLAAQLDEECLMGTGIRVRSTDYRVFKAAKRAGVFFKHGCFLVPPLHEEVGESNGQRYD